MIDDIIMLKGHAAAAVSKFTTELPGHPRHPDAQSRNCNLPNFIPKYLRMLRLPAIFAPSASRTGMRPKGISF